MASQQAALLQLDSFALQTCSKGSLTHPGTHSPPAQARAPGGKKPSSTGCFPTITSPAHALKKDLQNLQSAFFQAVFPSEEKQEVARVGREQVLNPNCCNSVPSPAITSPWDTQSTSTGFLQRGMSTPSTLQVTGTAAEGCNNPGRSSTSSCHQPWTQDRHCRKQAGTFLTDKFKHMSGPTSLEQLKSLNSAHTNPGKMGIVWYLGRGWEGITAVPISLLTEVLLFLSTSSDLSQISKGIFT